jgi:tetratricopeptide (TPR) repeat protein
MIRRESIPAAMLSRFRNHPAEPMNAPPPPLLPAWLRSLPLLLAPLAPLVSCSSEPSLTDEQRTQLVERYTETAQEYLKMGELDRAEGQTLKALELDEHYEKAKMIRAWTLQKRGSTEDILVAERIFREILPGGDFRSTLGLAECLERKGMAFDEAARDIESGKRVSEAPDPAARATALRNERDRAWKESIERYGQTLGQHADDVDALNGGMRVTALTGRLDDSVGYAERLLATIKPTREFWEKQVLRPEITDEDEQLFRQRIRYLVDLEIATRIHASIVLHKQEKDAEALDHLDAAVALDPDKGDLYGRRAELQRALGHPELAIGELDKFLRLSQESYDHPDVKRAWRLRKQCEDEMHAAEARAGMAR